MTNIKYEGSLPYSLPALDFYTIFTTLHNLRQRSGNETIKYHTRTRTQNGKVTKKQQQDKFKNKRVKRSAFSANIDKNNDDQQIKHRLGMVSKIFLMECLKLKRNN